MGGCPELDVPPYQLLMDAFARSYMEGFNTNTHPPAFLFFRKWRMQNNCGQAGGATSHIIRSKIRLIDRCVRDARTHTLTSGDQGRGTSCEASVCASLTLLI